jgi:hypothetical protein
MRSGDPPQEDLAKSGYMSERQVKLFSKPRYRLATCKELESKYGDEISPKKEKEKHLCDPLPVRHVGGETSPPPHSPGIPQSIFLFVAAHNTHTHTHTHTNTCNNNVQDHSEEKQQFVE